MLHIWIELVVQRPLSINWRASLVPAAAAVPVPMPYIEVVSSENSRS